MTAALGFCVLDSIYHALTPVAISINNHTGDKYHTIMTPNGYSGQVLPRSLGFKLRSDGAQGHKLQGLRFPITVKLKMSTEQSAF